MPEHDLRLQLTTTDPLADAAHGEALVQELARAGAPPAICGTHEPLRSAFTPERWARDWASRTVMWQSGGRGSDGQVIKRADEHDTHSYLLLDAASGHVAPASLAGALRGLAARFGADHGFVHRGPPAPAVSARRLEQGLPGLYWANVLGPPYVELFGEEPLRAAPAEVVEEIAPRTFYLQVPGELRERVIEHLGRDAFAPDATRVPSLGAAEAAVRRELGDPVAVALEHLANRAETCVAADERIEPTGLVISVTGAARLLRGATVEQVEEALRYTAARERLLVAGCLSSGAGEVLVRAEAPGAEPVEMRWPVVDGALGSPRAQRVPPRLLP